MFTRQHAVRTAQPELPIDVEKQVGGVEPTYTATGADPAGLLCLRRMISCHPLRHPVMTVLACRLARAAYHGSQVQMVAG